MTKTANRLAHALLLLPVILLAACVSVPRNYMPNEQQYRLPQLHTVVEAGLGENLIWQGRETERAAIFLPHEIKISLYRLKIGYYAQIGESERGFFYESSKYPGGGEILKNVFADPVKAVHVPLPHSRNEICIVTIFNVRSCETGGHWEDTTEQVLSKRFFQQLLVYGGGHSDKINVIYRERTGGFARSAFDHGVEYDLSKSNIIGYRGARIEVIDATNELIRYRVLSHFSDK